MGKAVPKNIKSKANLLLKTYGAEITDDFEANKKFVDSLGMPLSPVQRNLVAGFMTRKKGDQAKQ